MKLKPVVNADAPVRFIQEVQSPQFRQQVLETVLVPHLRVNKGFGPAEFYIQHCDLAESAPMCEVRLTGVSLQPGRQYRDALKALEELYIEKIEQGFHTDTIIQLMVSMMLDGVPFREKSSLLELPPRMVEGKSREKFRFDC